MQAPLPVPISLSGGAHVRGRYKVRCRKGADREADARPCAIPGQPNEFQAGPAEVGDHTLRIRRPGQYALGRITRLLLTLLEFKRLDDSSYE